MRVKLNNYEANSEEREKERKCLVLVLLHKVSSSMDFNILRYLLNHKIIFEVDSIVSAGLI